MSLRFVGIDPFTNGDNCPTVWVDEATSEIVIQGWTADPDTRRECLATGPIPDHETVLRLPARMAPILKEACDVAGGPIVQ